MMKTPGEEKVNVNLQHHELIRNSTRWSCGLQAPEQGHQQQHVVDQHVVGNDKTLENKEALNKQSLESCIGNNNDEILNNITGGTTRQQLLSLWLDRMHPRDGEHPREFSSGYKKTPVRML